ncbi:MAG: biopolymer transporter ExbD [Bacteroidetes bacterium]|nr:biopolymer transporter ExbD [Bacteroidota bacterium]
MNTDSGGGHKKKKGGSRSKKVSTRVDMTPMVDLGFLLITFFIFTTTMSKPASMEVNKPDTVHKPPVDILIPESRTMTVMMGKDDKVFWYMGINDPDNKKIPQIHTTDYSEYGLRKTLLESDKVARENNPNPAARNKNDSAYSKEGLIVIIRPCDNSTYKNVVDVLDEMKITEIKSFSWADIAPVDLTLLDKSGLNK